MHNLETISLGTFKQGTTFALAVELLPVINDIPVIDLTDYTVKSQIRTGALTLIDDLEVVPLANTTVQLFASNTAAWPVGPALIDILMEDDTGLVLTSATMSIKIINRITHQ